MNTLQYRFDGPEDAPVLILGPSLGTTWHMWDLTTQEPIGAPMTGRTDSVQTLGTATVAGRMIAVTGSNDGTTRLWDLAGCEEIGEPFTGHHLQMVTEAAGIPVAVTTSDGGVGVWDLTASTR
ncbi:hypothetical protein [Streptomyces sp. NPDC059010]|uniref:hypothetical protein n=1 Tax=Streptomyces sp. NPDC059010 TaxID=3346695 RepID=UPI0036AA7929